MIFTIDVTHHATVVLKRSRHETNVFLSAPVPFEIEDADPNEYRFVAKSGLPSNLLGERFSWFEKDGNFWRTLGDERSEGKRLQAHVDSHLKQIRSIGLPRNRVAQDEVVRAMGDTRAIVSSNAETMTEMVDRFLADDFVVIDGRIAVKAEVPVLTPASMRKSFDNDRMLSITDSRNLKNEHRLPICLWDVDFKFLRLFVSEGMVSETIWKTLKTFKSEAPLPFDRERALVRHVANGLLKNDGKRRSHSSLVREVRRLLAEDASSESLITTMAPAFLGYKDFERLSAMVNPTPRRIVADRNEGEVVMSLRRTQKDAVQTIDCSIPEIKLDDTRRMASVSLDDGTNVDVLWSDGWLVPFPDPRGTRSVKVPSVEGHAETSVSQWLTRIADESVAIGAVTDRRKLIDDPEELIAFARKHLASIDGNLYVRSGEPILIQHGSSTFLLPTSPSDPFARVRSSLANETNGSLRLPFSLTQFHLLTQAFDHLKDERDTLQAISVDKVVSVDIDDPQAFELSSVEAMAAHLTKRLDHKIDGTYVTRTLRRMLDDAVDEAVEIETLLGQETHHSQVAALAERLHALSSEISSSTIYDALSIHVEFQILRDVVLPNLNLSMTKEDELALTNFNL